MRRWKSVWSGPGAADLAAAKCRNADLSGHISGFVPLDSRANTRSRSFKPMLAGAQKLSIYFNYLDGKPRDRQRSAAFVARIAEPAERRVSDARDMICTQNGKGDRGLLRHVQPALRAANRMREIFESFCCTPPRGCVEFRDFAGGAVSNREKISTINFYSWGLHCCAMAKTL